MKYMVPTFLIALFLLASCGSDDKNGSSAAKDSTTVNDITSNPDYKKGLETITKYDCLTCHKVAEKFTGPAYQDVAAKYAGMDTAVQHLTHKVRTGGSGVWGNVPMLPHPNLPQADAEAIVKYILLLKK